MSPESRNSGANRTQQLVTARLFLRGLVHADAPSSPFPPRSYAIVSNEETDDIVSWMGNGKQFTVHQLNEFSTKILPQNFNHPNFSSFVRQLNSYVSLPRGFSPARRHPPVLERVPCVARVNPRGRNPPPPREPRPC